jgi:hypothetical protein
MAGGRTLLGGASTRFALRLVHDARLTSALHERVEVLAARYGRALDVATLRRSPEFAARYGAEPAEQLVLVRPDGYLGFRGAAADIDALDRYLEGVLLASA